MAAQRSGLTQALGPKFESMATPSTSETYVSVPGGELYVRHWSVPSPSEPAIFLLHDSLGSVEQWRDFPSLLAEETNRSVYAYDRLGFGKSSPRTELPSPDFVFEEAEKTLPALMQALEIDRFVPFGHSVGGGMALAAAATFGEKCQAVVSESAQAFVEPLTLTGIRAAQSQFASPEQFAKIKRWHGDKAQWVLDAWVQVWLSPAFASWSLDSYLKRIMCPTLVIHGERDEYGSLAFPSRIAAGVTGPAEQAILSGGHVPHREQQAEVLQIVGRFLRQQFVLT